MAHDQGKDRQRDDRNHGKAPVHYEHDHQRPDQDQHSCGDVDSGVDQEDSHRADVSGQALQQIAGILFVVKGMGETLNVAV